MHETTFYSLVLNATNPNTACQFAECACAAALGNRAHSASAGGRDGIAGRVLDGLPGNGLGFSCSYFLNPHNRLS